MIVYIYIIIYIYIYIPPLCLDCSFSQVGIFSKIYYAIRVVSNWYYHFKVDGPVLSGLIKCPSKSAPMADVFGKPPLCSLCLTLLFATAAQHVLMFKTSLGVGELCSSLRGCSRMTQKVIPAHFWQFDYKSLWHTFGETIAEEVKMVQQQEERDEWENRVESTWPVEWQRYQDGIKHCSTSKEYVRLLLVSCMLSPQPFLFPVTKEGLTSPTLARRGWCRKLSSLPSLPLMMVLAWEEREVRAMKGERRVNPPC